MKKFTLTVSQPCHESWDEMLPEEKGRYCAACRKTVVDFSAMSDRQLAEFFKTRREPVCGRFYSDQLNRELSVPKKHIPWAMYLFRLTWPAFVLMLKSCTQKKQTTGLTIVRPQANDRRNTMGDTVFNIAPAVTEMRLQVPEPKTLKGELILEPADVDVQPVNGSTDSLAKGTSNVDTSEQRTNAKPLCFQETERLRNVIMGGISISTIKKQVPPVPLIKPQTEQTTQPLHATVFPNPVRNGQVLNIRLEKAVSGVYQVVNAAGQLVTSGTIQTGEKQKFTLTIPSWPGGIYFIRIIDTASKESTTEKFLVQQ